MIRFYLQKMISEKQFREIEESRWLKLQKQLVLTELRFLK